MTVEKDEAVQRGLKHLRSVKDPEITYEIALMIMAFAAAKDGGRDKPRILTLAHKLEALQLKSGSMAGCWNYGPLGEGDRSNGQFAILGLRDAVHAGIRVDRTTWRRARHDWLSSQNADGGWGYSSLAPSSRSSMTAAGVATLVITDLMLRDDSDVGPDGKPNCCSQREPNTALQNALNWIARSGGITVNRGTRGWTLYYLYGLERAGRLSGRRFFGRHDWYRRGAELLVNAQLVRGNWRGSGHAETQEIVATSFALLFLSKGLAPILISKLKYGPPGIPDDNNWNKHRDDIRNLTDLITGLPKWPKLLTWQIVDIDKIDSAQELMLGSIQYISGEESLQFKQREKVVALLKEYINQGGFIFAVNCCGGFEFDKSFRELVRDMFPNGEAQLKKLPPSHDVFRAEYPLPDSVELWGVELGCRTAIIYSPDDLSCYWNKWMRHDPPKRHQNLKTAIIRKTRIGVNVVAYATGREPVSPLVSHHPPDQGGKDVEIERGLLQIANIRFGDGRDAAPLALKNLLLALNRTVGLAASTKRRSLPATDPNIFKYPILFMHGRNRFELSEQERKQLKVHLARGGVLFANAVCGSSQFDRSFRHLMKQVFPKQKLERIPPNHEMFTTDIGFDIRQVKRRVPEADNRTVVLNSVVKVGEPFLEGIELDGRYAVVYSKYDISCAIQRQASVACTGYVSEDATKLAINVILYAMLQDVRYSK